MGNCQGLLAIFKKYRFRDWCFEILLKFYMTLKMFSDSIIKDLQNRYEQTRKSGFYKHIIRDLANIKALSCSFTAPCISKK